MDTFTVSKNSKRNRGWAPCTVFLTFVFYLFIYFLGLFVCLSIYLYFEQGYTVRLGFKISFITFLYFSFS